MKSEDPAPWQVGTKVAWYGPRDQTATGVAEVEKVYKTGHVIVRGRRFRVWGSGVAYETGDRYYSKASIKLLTPATQAEIQKHRKTQTARKVGEWLQKCDADRLPDDAMAALVAAMKSETEPSTT